MSFLGGRTPSSLSVVVSVVLAGGLLSPSAAFSHSGHDDHGGTAKKGKSFAFEGESARGRATIRLSGTVSHVVIDKTAEAYKAGEKEETFSILQTDSGVVVPLPEKFEDAPNGGQFDGEFVVDAATAKVAAAEGVDTAAPAAALTSEQADAVAASLAQAPTQPAVLSANVAQPNNSTVATQPKHHRAFVAVMANKGAMPKNATIKNSVTQARSYWVREAEGLIPTFKQFGKVRRYKSSYNYRGCGLGAAAGAQRHFTNIANEALRKTHRKAFRSKSRTDHLIVFVSKKCFQQMGSRVLGVGTIGRSIHANGVTIIATGSGATNQTVVHELGHNMSLGHSYGPRGEYDDPFSPMGAGYSVRGRDKAPALDAAMRRLLNIGAGGRVETVSAGSPKSFVVQPRGSGASRRALIITDRSGRKFSIALRDGLGYDAQVPYGQGLSAQTAYLTSAEMIPNSRTSERMFSYAARNSFAMPEKASTSYYVARGSNAVVRFEPADGRGNRSIRVGATTGSVKVETDYPAPTVNGTRRVGSRVVLNTAYLPAATRNSAVTWRLGKKVIARGRTITLPASAARKTVTATIDANAHREIRTVRFTVDRGILKAPRPAIKGKAKVGRKLKAMPRRWTTGTRLQYRWFANGKRIKGKAATKRVLKVSRKLKGKRITVRVYGSKPGYSTAKRTSKAVRVR